MKNKGRRRNDRYHITYLTYISHEMVKSRNLGVSPAAETKVNYIVKKIANKYPVRIVTFARSTLFGKHFNKIDIQINKQIRFEALSEIEPFTKLGKKLYGIVWHLKILLRMLKLGSEDIVIAYHSLTSSFELWLAKKICGFNLVIELEEIYQDVVKCGKWKAYWEKKVISIADSYILATEALNKQINRNKPYVVVNGTYDVEKDRKVRFNDGKIHCVYAGTLDPTKGGAAAAAAAAEFLPSNYHVHILGFGTEQQKEMILKIVNDIQKKAECTLTYDGLKTGEEYIRFLQKCHIGLCTQIPDAKYIETSFPSKILVYLANGLRVLSVDIPAVRNSGVEDVLYYYNVQDSREIANAIKSIDINDTGSGREKLGKLDELFQREIIYLLKNIR